MSNLSEEQVLRELSHAINVILDPTTSNDDRKSAQQYCDNICFNHGSEFLFPLSIRIIRSKEIDNSFSHSLSLRMFALKILEDMVKDMSILGNISTIPSIRDEIYSLITIILPSNSSSSTTSTAPPSSSSKQVTRESKLMQDKIISVLVQLTIRIWPQYWPDLIDSLLELLNLDPISLISGGFSGFDVILPCSQSIMSLSIIRGIIDEIHPRVVDIGFLGISLSNESLSTIDIDNSRRSELQKGIGHVMPKILQTLFPLINNLSSSFWKCIKDPMYNEISRYFISYSIQLLELWISVTYWTPLEPFKDMVVNCWRSILSFMDTMVDIVLQNNSNNDEYILALQHSLDTMLNFIARPQKPQEVQFGLTVEIYSSLLGPITSSLTKLSCYLPGSSSYEDDNDFQESIYGYFKQLTDILVTASNTHVIPSILNSRDQTFLTPMYELMFNLASMDSLMIKSMIDSFWSIHLRNISSYIASLQATKTTRSSSKSSPSSKEVLLPIALKDKLQFLLDYCMVPLSNMSNANRKVKLSSFNDIDFSSDGEEYTTLLATNQNRVMEILRNISSLAPNEITKLITKRLSYFLLQKIGSSNDFTFAPIFISERSSRDLGEWEALCWAMDCSLKTIFSSLKEKDIFVDDWVKEVCGSLLLMANMISPRSVDIVIFNSSGADVIFKWILPQKLIIPCLDLISSLNLGHGSEGIVQDSKAYLSLLLRSLFEITLKFESKTAPLSLSLAVKARAGSTLLKACQTRVQPFIDSLGWLVGLFQEIPQKFEGGSERERRFFSDLLLSISSGHILNQTENCEQVSCQLLQLVGEPLIKMFSLIKDTSSKPQIIEMVRNPSQLNMQWNSFLAQFQSTITILKKMKSSSDFIKYPELDGMISAFCMASLSIIDEIMIIINSMTIEGIFDHLYSIDDDWRNCSLLESTSGIISANSSAEDLMKIGNSSIDNGLRWFWMLRVSLYVNYGLTASLISGNEQPSSYELPLHYLLPSTYKDIEVWTLQIKHIWTPLLSSMTTVSASILALPVIRQIMNSIIGNFGLGILNEGFNSLLSVENLTEEKKMESTLDSGLQVLLSFLYEILLPSSTERDKRVDPLLHTGGFLLISGQICSDLNVDSICPGSQSYLSNWLMSSVENNDLLLRIIELLANMLRWKSSIVCGKIINIISRWLPFILLTKNTEIRPFIQQYILGDAISGYILQIMGQASLSDVHPSCLNLIAEIYKWQIFFQSDIFDQNIISILGEEKGRSIVVELRNVIFAAPPTSVYPTQSTVNSQCRQQRIKMRQLLCKALLHNGQGKIGNIIPKLPDSMVLLGRLKKQQKELLSLDDDDDNNCLALDSIFE